MKIFIDDSGGFSWTTHGVSLFCAATVPDRGLKSTLADFEAWKSRQRYFMEGKELKGTDLSDKEQASFVNGVVLKNAGVRLTLSGTKTIFFKKEIAEQYIKDAASILRATAKLCDSTNKTSLGDFYRRMAKWVSERSPENLMWIISLGSALRLSIQHSIVQFADQVHDSEFEDIEILIDRSFIKKTAHLDFWKEWLRNFLHDYSSREPMQIPKEWAQRNHPFYKKHARVRGMVDWSDLFRRHMTFGESKDSLGIQIADICANIGYRKYSGTSKYRPYNLLRSRISGKHNTEMHYGVLDEACLLTGAPENHVRLYTGAEEAISKELTNAKQKAKDEAA